MGQVVNLRADWQSARAAVVNRRAAYQAAAQHGEPQTISPKRSDACFAWTGGLTARRRLDSLPHKNLRASRKFGIYCIVLGLCLPLAAQRAQLGRQGRQRERGAATAAEPLRKLPRKLPAVSPPPRPIRNPTLTPDAPLSEDRVRRLVHGVPGPLAAVQAQATHL